MRIDIRKTLTFLFIAGGAGAILLPLAVYNLGLALAPRPVPATTHVPPVFADALWARLEGGRAKEMKPVNPFTVAHFVGCVVVSDVTNDGKPPEDGACAEALPAVQGAEQLARVYLHDEHFNPDTPKYPFGQMATMVWLTRNFTKTQLLDTFAERGRFGFGLRGAEKASRYYFDRPLADLSVPQAALLAAFAAQKDVNPWGEPELAAEWRNRILNRMRNGLMIDEATYEKATRSPLGLQPEQPPLPPRQD